MFQKNYLKICQITNTYCKTHTKLTETVKKIINDNVRVILSIRDLRDMMISRYYHILNYKFHWQHNLLKDLSFDEGFKISLTNKKMNTKIAITVLLFLDTKLD